jgi:hypothetical protein
MVTHRRPGRREDSLRAARKLCRQTGFRRLDRPLGRDRPAARRLDTGKLALPPLSRRCRNGARLRALSAARYKTNLITGKRPPHYNSARAALRSRLLATASRLTASTESGCGGLPNSRSGRCSTKPACRFSGKGAQLRQPINNSRTVTLALVKRLARLSSPPSDASDFRLSRIVGSFPQLANF